MWEYKYGKEPLDTRLCFLRLIRKWWVVSASVAAGALLFGGIYFLTHVVYGPAREYTAESQFYIEYKNAVTQEQQYTFYNKETWESLIHTDLFMDEMMAAAEEPMRSMGLFDSEEAVRESISRSVFATLMTDVRLVHVTVTTNNPDYTMLLTDALEPAFIKFGKTQREIDEIRPVLIPKKATLTAVDNRTVRACILGAVLFVGFTLFFMYLYAVLDTSFYIPLEFERRFGIPMELPGKEQKAEAVRESVEAREREDGTYTLYVKSGDHNRMLAEKTIRDLIKEGKTVTGAVLMQPDEKLIRQYFMTGSWLRRKALRKDSTEGARES